MTRNSGDSILIPKQLASVVVAEGLFIYLKEEAVRQVFREVARCTELGTWVAFSHGITINGFIFANALLGLIWEPWLSSCASADQPGYIGQGWSVIATRGTHSGRGLEGFAAAEKLENTPNLES